MLIINQKEESIGTNYLSSYFSHYPYSIQRPKIRNKILIHLLFHSCCIRTKYLWIQEKSSGSTTLVPNEMRIFVYCTVSHPEYYERIE